MDLKELLKKATKRPWSSAISAVYGPVKQRRSVSNGYPMRKNLFSMDQGHPTYRYDAALLVHAVNNFERMYRALYRAYYSEAFPTMHEEDRLFIKEAFRQAEEVSL